MVKGNCQLRGRLTRRPTAGAAVLLLGLLLTGCGPSADQIRASRGLSDYFSGDYLKAIEAFRPLAEKTNEDFVLNNLRLGSAALAAYDLVEAEAAFLRAYEVINSLDVNRGGRTVGAVLVQESIRIWQGEPYEKALANFYLGLVYYMRGDYANARGALENALFKLREYADDDDAKQKYREVESTFVLASVMLGRCWQRLGRDDLAEAQFEYVRRQDGRLSGLADAQVHRRSNVLLVVDFGFAPMKVTDFDGAIVGFAPTPADAGRIPWLEVRVDGRRVDTGRVGLPTIDTVAMAQQRRWQSIDTVRAVKGAAGTGLIVGGAILMQSGGRDDRDRNTRAAAGLGMMLAGLLLKASAQADTRQWEMAPRSVFLVPLELPAGAHDIEVYFPEAGLRQRWQSLPAPARGEATYYLRVQRSAPGPYVWPPATQRK